jgi:hypothetical protein
MNQRPVGGRRTLIFASGGAEINRPRGSPLETWARRLGKRVEHWLLGGLLDGERETLAFGVVVHRADERTAGALQLERPSESVPRKVAAELDEDPARIPIASRNINT